MQAQYIAAALHKLAPGMRTCREARVKLKGFNLLGSGWYGAAYLHEATGRVLKVSFTTGDGTMGYMAAVAQYCAKHGHPPHSAPMVYEFGRNSRFWWAVMERVIPASDIPNCAYTLGGWYDRHLEPGRSNEKQIQEDVFNLMRDLDLTSSYSEGSAKSSEDCGWDTHRGNVGLTADFRRVVFDPFGDGCKTRKAPPRMVRPKVQHGPSRGRWAH